MSVVLLAVAKDHLNIATTAHDAELQRMLDAAEARLAHEVGPFGTVTVTGEKHRSGGTLFLRKLPVQSVTSVTRSDGTAVTGLDVYSEAGLIYGAPGVTVNVTYTAGHNPVPADLVNAVVEMTRHLWETQRGNAPSALPSSDDLFGGSTGTFPDLPFSVQKMIAPYKRSVTVG